MAQQRSRGVVVAIWKNFINSLIPSKVKKSTVGTDHLGTKYYEIPADPQRGKRKPVRWFEATEKDKFDQVIPAEWEAWLRGRRANPPTQEEINRNVAIQQTAIAKAKELEENEIKTRPPRVETTQSIEEAKKKFPVYEDYETRPGDHERQSEDRKPDK